MTPGPTDPKVKALQEEYMDLLHAMQTGVKQVIEFEGTGEMAAAGPKHLRVGVNSALLQSSVLANLLIEKGVITQLEYWESLVEAWRDEVSGYEETRSAAIGVRVHLL